LPVFANEVAFGSSLSYFSTLTELVPQKYIKKKYHITSVIKSGAK
jgi:hypothetical protein